MTFNPKDVTTLTQELLELCVKHNLPEASTILAMLSLIAASMADFPEEMWDTYLSKMSNVLRSNATIMKKAMNEEA